jgi:hypothetical protein
MGDGSVHYRIRYKNWHFSKMAWRCLLYKWNGMFEDYYMTYEYALKMIKGAEDDALAKTKKKKGVFNIYRTEIPPHIPKDQIIKYTSTTDTKIN